MHDLSNNIHKPKLFHLRCLPKESKSICYPLADLFHIIRISQRHSCHLTQRAKVCRLPEPPLLVMTLQLMHVVVKCTKSNNYLGLLGPRIARYAFQHLSLRFRCPKCSFYDITQLRMVPIEQLLRICRPPGLELLHPVPLIWIRRQILGAKCVTGVHQVISACINS